MGSSLMVKDGGGEDASEQCEVSLTTTTTCNGTMGAGAGSMMARRRVGVDWLGEISFLMAIKNSLGSG
jgi:hypothetical protein